MSKNPPVIEPSTALTMPQRAAVALGESANAAKLRELAAQSAGILTVTNADGRAEAHRAGMVLVKTRTGITAKGKVAREDATAFSKAVIAMEKDLICLIQPEEDRVLALRDTFDSEVAAEVAEKKRIEELRIVEIRARIADIQNLPAKNASSNSATLYAVLSMLAMREIEADIFAELVGEARAAVNVAGPELDAMYKAVKVREQAEADRLAEIEAERVRIAADAEANRVEGLRLAALAEESRLAQVERDRVASEAETARLVQIAAEDSDRARVALDVKRQLEAQQAAFAIKEQEAAEAMRAESSRLAAARQKLVEDNAEFERKQAAAAAPVVVTPELAPAPEVLVIAVVAESVPVHDEPCRPTDAAIVHAVASGFGVSPAVAARWLYILDALAMFKEFTEA